jgi:hypothetical protein
MSEETTPDSVSDMLELSLTEDGVIHTYRMARTPDGCELVPGAAGRFASAGWAFFEDVQDRLDVEFFLDQFDRVLVAGASIARTGGNITSLEITTDVSWLRLIWQEDRGAEISTQEFYRQLQRVQAFLT